MISVILYGRNDDYGYNLHKRAALSLNCIAHVLCAEDDEIIFVDYNTPDDFPTFPEAIRDTLTPKAKKLLRILRVRPAVHRRYTGITHLPALEPIARNTGIRRSNRSNRWILSTNTDMIFVPRGSSSLSNIVGELQSGYYHTPRFDVPESLWETFDRFDPETVITETAELGETAHLNEIVMGADHLLYDAPGDFQLVEREELFAIQGFCESMLQGWHVDANLAKRLYMRHGHVGDLATRISAYHCEHTRSFSTMHYVSKENDIAGFVDNLTQASIAEQAESWGLANEQVEELSLASCPSEVYLRALTNVIPGEQVSPPEVLYAPESFNLVGYDTPHVLPYLADVFVNLPRSWSVAWLGGREQTLTLFSQIWEQLGYTGQILVPEEAAADGLCCQRAARIDSQPWDKAKQEAQVFVFDFADLEGKGGISSLQGDLKRRASALLAYFFSLVSFERRLLAEEGERRIVLINAINNDFEKLSQEFLLTVRTPISSRIRHGFVAPSESRRNWLAHQLVGVAGERRGNQVFMRRGQPGHVIFGPYFVLPPGRYRATIEIETEPAKVSSVSAGAPLVFEVVSGQYFLAQRDITWNELSNRRHASEFQVTPETVYSGNSYRTEVRVWTRGELSASIVAVELETRSDFLEEPLNMPEKGLPSAQLS